EVAEAVGTRPVAWSAVASRGYGRVSAHWRVSLAGGRHAFVKHALTHEAAEWVRKERRVYESVRGPFMPGYLGAYDDRGTTLIVIGDLSSAEWPPPWSPQRVGGVLARPRSPASSRSAPVSRHQRCARSSARRRRWRCGGRR